MNWFCIMYIYEYLFCIAELRVVPLIIILFIYQVSAQSKPDNTLMRFSAMPKVFPVEYIYIAS